MLLFWVILYDIPARKKKLSKAELTYINGDAPEAEPENDKKVSWSKILSFRQTWSFVFGKFLTDPLWWFYLFWISSYFHTTYNLDISHSAIYVSTIYVAASFGSILGKYLSGVLIKKGMPVYKARKITMLIVALLVVPIVFVQFTTNVWTAVALISLAAAHQAWSCNIFTAGSYMFPKKTVSSVVGIGGMAGSVGGILFRESCD